jgi:hypothetical protein
MPSPDLHFGLTRDSTSNILKQLHNFFKYRDVLTYEKKDSESYVDLCQHEPYAVGK